MRIDSVRIDNFRVFADQTIEFNPYTCFVGANGAGKSTVLAALNVFFRERQNSLTDSTTLVKEDFHNRNTEDPIRITVTFVDLSDAAKEDFRAYVRNDQLVVSAVAKWDDGAQRAEVTQHGQRVVMRAFAKFFERQAGRAKAAELKALYTGLRADHPDLPEWKSQEQGAEALRAFESARPEQCELMPSEDQFYGFTGGANLLAKYVQWVYVPAVKDATEEQVAARDSALSALLARTVAAKAHFSDRLAEIRAGVEQQYAKLLEEKQIALTELSQTLAKRIAEWAHPKARMRLRWEQEGGRAIQVNPPQAVLVAGEGSFEGEIIRFGHGLQRSYIIALLQELAASDTEGGPTLLLGCEEPELYQHPPQARHLHAVLEKLAQENAQIVVTTHSPLFVSGRDFQSVRLVRRSDIDRAAVTRIDGAGLAGELKRLQIPSSRGVSSLLAKLHQTLQPALNEMFFAARLVLVEGVEDVAHLHTWLELTGRWSEYRRAGFHTVPTNGKGELVRAVAIAKQLGIPFFAMWDCDGRAKDPTPHRRDNLALFDLTGAETTDAFPEKSVIGERFAAWPDNLGSAVRGCVDSGAWDRAYAAASKEFDSAPDLEKCTLHIAARLAKLHADGIGITCLNDVCSRLLAVG